MTITKQDPITESPITKHPFDLEARTLKFARAVIRLCRDVKSDTISREIVSQLVRAAGSVGANYREANDALSKKDFLHRIRITRREAKEAHYWLELLAEADPARDAEVAGLRSEALELRSIFSAIVERSS